jgi:hypothetical protein
LDLGEDGDEDDDERWRDDAFWAVSAEDGTEPGSKKKEEVVMEDNEDDGGNAFGRWQGRR